MVRIPVQGREGLQTSIAGGFVLVPVASLMGAWCACRSHPLGVGEFRTWLACREMVARRDAGIRRAVVGRDAPASGREPTYTVAELARLLGVVERRARASLRRLEAAGLIRWSESALVLTEFELGQNGLEDSIGGGRGSVAIPRRILRLLVRGARPALLATTLGMLLRCLSRRKGGFEGRGRVKASWIARVFAVDLRRVKAARLELVALGWIAREPSNQGAENRWGRAYRIDLGWNRAGAGGRSLPPLAEPRRPEIATPSVNPDPLPEREKDQEPAGSGPTGDRLEGAGEADQLETAGMEARSLPGPKLVDVQPEDLTDTGRLLELHRQAVAQGIVGSDEADRFRFVAAAEHALAMGHINPPGLFAHLIRQRAWRYVTGADEDRATTRLKAWRKVSGPSPVVPVLAASPANFGDSGLSADAQLVSEVRRAVIRAGMFRDPWAWFAMKNPDWDRGRWDSAVRELRLA
jgi:hypothetical protein